MWFKKKCCKRKEEEEEVRRKGKNIVTLHGVLPIAVSLFSGGRDQSVTVEDEHIWRPLVGTVSSTSP